MRRTCRAPNPTLPLVLVHPFNEMERYFVLKVCSRLHISVIRMRRIYENYIRLQDVLKIQWINKISYAVPIFDLVSNQVWTRARGSDGRPTGQTSFFLPSPSNQRWMQPKSGRQNWLKQNLNSLRCANWKLTKSKRKIKFLKKMELLFSSLSQIRAVTKYALWPHRYFCKCSKHWKRPLGEIRHRKMKSHSELIIGIRDACSGYFQWL